MRLSRWVAGAWQDVGFFIVALPVAYGSYFARLAADSSHGLYYIVPISLSFILVSLDNIQDHLENPFDQVSEDDVTINAEKFVSGLELQERAGYVPS